MKVGWHHLDEFNGSGVGPFQTLRPKRLEVGKEAGIWGGYDRKREFFVSFAFPTPK